MATTVALKRLATAQLTTTPAIIYTAEGVSARIFMARMTSISPNEESFSFWAPEGGSPADTNVIADEDGIAANDSIEIGQLKELVLEPGWSLWGQAGTEAVLTVVISGIQVTAS